MIELESEDVSNLKTIVDILKLDSLRTAAEIMIEDPFVKPRVAYEITAFQNKLSEQLKYLVDKEILSKIEDLEVVADMPGMTDFLSTQKGRKLLGVNTREVAGFLKEKCSLASSSQRYPDEGKNIAFMCHLDDQIKDGKPKVLRIYYQYNWVSYFVAYAVAEYE